MCMPILEKCIDWTPPFSRGITAAVGTREVTKHRGRARRMISGANTLTAFASDESNQITRYEIRQTRGTAGGERICCGCSVSAAETKPTLGPRSLCSETCLQGRPRTTQNYTHAECGCFIRPFTRGMSVPLWSQSMRRAGPVTYARAVPTTIASARS